MFDLCLSGVECCRQSLPRLQFSSGAESIQIRSMSTALTTNANDFSVRELAMIENNTEEIGRYLFEHLEVRRPKIWDRRWWDDRIMAWAMSDEAVKVQLFRFIDVLPMLNSPAAVAQHLEEYLADVEDRLPGAARFGLIVATPTAIGRRALAATAKRNALRMQSASLREPIPKKCWRPR